MPASNAYDGEVFETGHIYVAPPDRHMLLEGDHIRITRGPKENRFRPAVDPLFRSAAFAHSERVIGIILSGALDDGTSGLWIVKSRGGIAIVQDPADAAVRSMPESASRAVAVDYSIPMSQMPALLERLCSNTTRPQQLKVDAANEADRLADVEIRTAIEGGSVAREIMQHGQLSPYACPECHGVLTALKEGGSIRYRCHTGHAYSTDALLSGITRSVDDGLWSAIRGTEECMMLLNHLGDHSAEQNDTRLAARFFRKAAEADDRLKLLKGLVMKNEALSADRITDEADQPPRFP